MSVYNLYFYLKLKIFLNPILQVIIIDPLNKESGPLVSSAQSLYSYSAPLRIGFVFFTNSNMSETGKTDPSVAINNVYHYLIENKSLKDALNFLSSVSIYIQLINISYCI
jgi:UDP-glucose:glycoprotein glucosyltransferase